MPQIDTLAAGENVIEDAPQAIIITPAPTAVLGLVGLFERGPIDEQVVCNGPDDFSRVFGSYIANGDAVLAVDGFFAEGGTEVHVVRTCHHTDPTDPTTKTSAAGSLTLDTSTTAAGAGVSAASNPAPWAVSNNQTLVVVVDGGSNLTTTFTGAPATATGGTATYALSNGETLLVGTDSFASGAAQTITFATGNFVSIGAATAAEVAAVINAQLIGGSASVSANAVVIASDTNGSGSRLAITGGTARTALGFSTGTQAGTGNVSNLNSVQSSEAISLLNTAAAGAYVATYSGSVLKLSTVALGASHNLLVTVGSTASSEFGFDHATHAGTDAGVAATLEINGASDGTFTKATTITVAAATNGLSSSFNFLVLNNGLVVETWPNQNMTLGDPNYIVTRLNDPNTGSRWVNAVDLAAAGNNVPAPGTFGPLTGGADGLSGLVDADFVGGTGVNGDVGLRCLDSVKTLALDIVPGRATAAVHGGLITYNEVTRNGFVFAILDPPLNQSAAQIVNYVQNVAVLENLSELAAIYWPNVLIDNPDETIYGAVTTIVCPPSGIIAGRYAKTDSASPSGVFDPPAGTTNGALSTVRGVEMTEVLKKPKRDLVFPALINPISRETNTPWFLDGARCLKSDGNWPTIGERRGIIFAEVSIIQALVVLRHRNINERLLKEGADACEDFLLIPTRAGKLATTNPAEAFLVDFGPGLNNASTNKQRTTWGRVSIATSEPNEFTNIIVAPDTRMLDAELAALATASQQS